MMYFCTQNTADSGSAADEALGKLRLLILRFVSLALTISLFIFSGCASDDATKSEAGTSDGPEWASLYEGQIPLYEGEIPNSIPYFLEETSAGEDESVKYYNVSFPTLSVFLPPDDVATGAAVIICPGGGYASVLYGVGCSVAEELAENGIAAFVLKYRLPNDLIMLDRTIGPLQDAQQAIKTVRKRAAQWEIDPEKVGIMGHSAGGHLAATAGTHFDETFIPHDEGYDLRPDFIILVSSVISMDEDITHAGSRTRLIGNDPETSLVEYFSCELHVTGETPPAWIAHAENDTTVSVENSILFFDALAEYGVPAELATYETGGHGFVANVSTNGWMASLLYWMETMGFTPTQ